MTLQTVKKFLVKYWTYILALIIIVPVLWVLIHPAIISRIFESFQDATDPTNTETTSTEPPTTTPVNTKCSMSQIDTVNTVMIPAI